MRNLGLLTGIRDAIGGVMNCVENAFCSSISPALRSELCAHCRRQLVKAGSIQMYEDFERQASLIIDGVILISGHVGEDVVGYSDEPPTCYLGVPGRLLSTNVTFRDGGGTEAYGYNSMEYLTDCCVAHIEHQVIRRLFDAFPEFARAAMLSSLRIMEDGCMMTAILRAGSVYLSVYHLVQYLAQQGAYLTQQQIADLISHDRASVSKAMGRIKDEQPSVWSEYMANKGRIVRMTHPGIL